MEAKWRQESKSILEDSGSWHYYPFLPVKRYHKNSGQMECCFVVHPKPTVIFLENLFITVDKAKEKGISMREYVSQLKTLEYKTIDEMLDDGWEVD